jgi:hypothetical protein
MKKTLFVGLATVLFLLISTGIAMAGGDRFTDMGDGTIRDNDSGLIWLKNANCSDFPYTDEYGLADWENAKKAAAALNNGECDLADGSEEGDWRLPTKAEWEAFMSKVYVNPALVNTVGDAQWSEGDAFTGVQYSYYFYWSSTDADSTFAWCAEMRDGIVDSTFKVLTYYVWPVRGANKKSKPMPWIPLLLDD